MFSGIMLTITGTEFQISRPTITLFWGHGPNPPPVARHIAN